MQGRVAAASAFMAAFCFAALAATPLAADTPNVVFVLADDLGYGDLGCQGHPYARTPHLDRLATQGSRFTQFYSTGVTCCPARTGFMTSKFPASFPVYPANGGFADRLTVTELLKRRGYVTGHFGKWHIGPNEAHGTYSIDEVNSGGTTTGGKTRDMRGRDAPIFDNAIAFIEQHRERPFYVNVWGHISHHPVVPPAEYVERFRDVAIDESRFAPPMLEKFAHCRGRGGDVSEHLRRYLADVSSLDDDVGRLLRKIDELGLADRTIVVFSSDQGPAPLADEANNRKKGANDKEDLRLNAMGYAGVLRGGKHGMYEGGVRVPLIVRWPGHVPAGRVDDRSVTSGIDWLPTLCAITSAPIDAAAFDGEDVSAAWLGGTHARRKPLFWKTSNPRSTLAIRDGPWKLHLPSGNRGEVELFDLDADPGEQNNLAASRPEVVTELRAQLQRWNATLPKEYIKTDDKQD